MEGDLQHDLDRRAQPHVRCKGTLSTVLNILTLYLEVIKDKNINTDVLMVMTG